MSDHSKHIKHRTGNRNTAGKEVKRNAPSQSVVDFHTQDDVDTNNEAHHHTLGYGPGQAAPGVDLEPIKNRFGRVLVPLTTTTSAGIPDLVWDSDDHLVMTEVSYD